jgi:2-aminoadipate transaminase
MTAAPFDFTPLLPTGLPPAAARWNGRVKFDFTGGNNDPDALPLDGLIAAADAVLRREGRTLSTYGLNSGPQGYRALRDFLAVKLRRDAGMHCSADDLLITSGSLQALDLVNNTLLTRGDTVLIEEDCYQGSINRLLKLGVTPVGIPLDRDGLRIDALPLARRQALLQLAEDYGVPVFEDDCYADLSWSGERPPALYALSDQDNVIYIGSFSKTIAPALRVGYIVAPWSVMSRMLAIKTDAGSGALEQMVLAEYCTAHFAKHVPVLRKSLRAKLVTLMEALREHFGAAAEFDDPQGGIFLWVKLPDNVDALKLFTLAQAAGVAINPGPEWSVNKAHAKSHMRLCFANLSHEEINQGVAALAEVCKREFGAPG